MPYAHNISGSISACSGDYHLQSSVYEQWRADAATALDILQSKQQSETDTIFSMPKRRKDLPDIKAIADQLRENCKDILIVGTGGSSLGGRALCAIGTTSEPKLHFVDNIDPNCFITLINSLDIRSTGLVFISKSGSTVETVSLAIVLLEKFGRTGNAKDRIVAITECRESPLLRLMNEFEIRVIPHDENVGGRFSVFSAVGLLPGLLAGLDPIAFRSGAQSVIDLSKKNPLTASPVEGAALSAGLAVTSNISMSVMMTYCNQLSEFVLWYRQLWAESLGKFGKGTTPIQGIGPADEHSQLQLYLDGPRDKFITLITCPPEETGPRIPIKTATQMEADYLGNHTFGELIDAFSSSTFENLKKNGRPVREIRLERINESNLGALMMHFILETLITAELWNLDPFGQPAVDASKQLVKVILGRKGDFTR